MSVQRIFLPLAIVASSIFSYALNVQSAFLREIQAILMQYQLVLVLYLCFWCVFFIFLTFCQKNWAMSALLLIAILNIFRCDVQSLPLINFEVLLMGIILGKGIVFLLQKEKCWVVNRLFLVGLVVLLAFASWWHSDVALSYYPGIRWIGLWDNPNTYGMLMGAGVLLAIGLRAANAKIDDRRWRMNPPSPGYGAVSPPSLSYGATSAECGVRNSEQKQISVWASWNSAPRSALRVFLWIAIVMMGMGLVMSYSRGAWLATAVGLVYLAWCYGKLKWGFVLPVVLLIVVAASLLWSRTPDSAPWYVKRADLGRPSAQHRVAAWEAGLKIMRDHPFGVGWGNAVSTYEKNYSPPEGGATALNTNNYLMIGTELGIPALLCFVVYVGLCFRKSPRIRNVEVMANHNNFGTGEAGRARHSVRAALGQTHAGAHGVTRPTFSVSQHGCVNAIVKCHRSQEVPPAGGTPVLRSGGLEVPSESGEAKLEPSHVGSYEIQGGEIAPSSWPSPPVGEKEAEGLRAACLAGALVFVVAFWFDGGLFKLPTAALFWVLLELGAERGKEEVRMQNAEV